ncbi:glycine-rich domain-containing protein [Pseudoalteromonas denitrificans]|uniref:Glycine-rich domain-containing protein n=1 Tax=Pseudoalteromonas denitrificans DSM 6059 TaxID=1123010 RepID=A0A1I1RWR7_9GAMM|nr:hypothetical protein [Pseudoalteromonas denitrificans]SFD35090.1 hypothetical protein SAMN02745724_04281 [Pseudoalteromonas denitrificans DSM 6059]
MLRSIEFSQPTKGSWFVPKGVTQINLMINGAGGGGALSAYDDRTQSKMDGMGGFGGHYIEVKLKVLPETKIPISIGKGGSGGTVRSPNGESGEATYFGNIVNVNGGLGGVISNSKFEQLNIWDRKIYINPDFLISINALDVGEWPSNFQDYLRQDESIWERYRYTSIGGEGANSLLKVVF